MPWVRTSDCEETTPLGSYCLCPEFPGNVLVPGAFDGETKSDNCSACGAFGKQVTPTLCCNLSGIAYEV